MRDGTSDARHVVVLTGAGVSAESGLGTFRDAGGTWTQVNIEEVATPKAYAANPARVHAFYDARRRQALAAQPNAAHRALAGLARDLEARGGRLTLVTQNVDDLHERAGSGRVIHMHGELARARCTGCDRVHEWTGDLAGGENGRGAPCPACGEPLRPHIVWFGEVPFRMDEIEDAVTGADLFVAIGTSGAVYPAAGYVDLARSHGVRTMEINMAPSDNAAAFDERRYGAATEAVPAWASSLAGTAAATGSSERDS